MHGNRPVMLIGFSLGARMELLRELFFLEHQFSIKNENWEDARKMVAGRFVNVYSTNDWTLGIIFRASLLSQGLAGIQPVDIIHGIENVDVTDYLEGHSSYLWKTKKILEQLDLESYYPNKQLATSGGGWGWGGGGGGWYKWGCGKGKGKGGGRGRREHMARRFNKDEYKLGEFAQCMGRRCRGMRLDCPLHCGGPCFYDCRNMCKAHRRRP
ncbi:hypothetical protein SLEP1_g14589 [Rubroshorea leprosula]|uniref:Uncharacterized protein n=1 Tax=Rubroshorea leprosula TaxID=152421 RepID=A0AAV5IQH8_9ROSI|nr:hypothetical protein SLEP1_g14589 [Rubroshorea leprosula]